MEIEILKGKETHIESCLSIVVDLPQYFTDNAIKTIGKDLRNHTLNVAMESNEVAGFVTVHHKNRYVAEISCIAVQPRSQHLGIGSALIDRIADELSDQGYRLLEVKTLSEDVEYAPYEITRQFYKKCGFMHLETIDPYPEWEPGNPCAIYIKILDTEISIGYMGQKRG